MYYNTTCETQLTLFQAQAKKQEDLVLEVYQMGKSLSPSEVWEWLVKMGRVNKDTPLTSIRRAISDLTKELKLTRTEVKVIGKYGRREFKWSLV